VRVPSSRLAVVSGTMGPVPKPPPESTKNSLRLRILHRARERWPQLDGVDVRFRGGFVYVDGTLTNGAVLPLLRLRYHGSARAWGFAIYLASSGKYQDSVLPRGLPSGGPEVALDCACGLYLADPIAWQTPPTNF